MLNIQKTKNSVKVLKLNIEYKLKKRLLTINYICFITNYFSFAIEC